MDIVSVVEQAESSPFNETNEKIYITYKWVLNNTSSFSVRLHCLSMRYIFPACIRDSDNNLKFLDLTILCDPDLNSESFAYELKILHTAPDHRTRIYMLRPII